MIYRDNELPVTNLIPNSRTNYNTYKYIIATILMYDYYIGITYTIQNTKIHIFSELQSVRMICKHTGLLNLA